jgi:hypothetical protein
LGVRRKEDLEHEFAGFASGWHRRLNVCKQSLGSAISLIRAA